MVVGVVGSSALQHLHINSFPSVSHLAEYLCSVVDQHEDLTQMDEF